MDLLVVRHAIAEPRAEDGGTQPDDSERALTSKGRRRMKRGARGLHRILPEITLLASSPLVRARQTAEIVSAAYDDIPITIVPQLSPGIDPDALVEWLRESESAGTIAIVGHEPSLGEFASYLLTGRAQSFLPFEKGGACLIECPTGVVAGESLLVWLATARNLRRLGRRG